MTLLFSASVLSRLSPGSPPTDAEFEPILCEVDTTPSSLNKNTANLSLVCNGK